MEAFPSNTISGHAFSVDGLAWTWSEVEPYGNAVKRTDGTTDHFATLERPKLVWGDASNPTRPTHILQERCEPGLGRWKCDGSVPRPCDGSVLPCAGRRWRVAVLMLQDLSRHRLDIHTHPTAQER